MTALHFIDCCFDFGWEEGHFLGWACSHHQLYDLGFEQKQCLQHNYQLPRQLDQVDQLLFLYFPQEYLIQSPLHLLCQRGSQEDPPQEYGSNTKHIKALYLEILW